jgi:hypothetical protein
MWGNPKRVPKRKFPLAKIATREASLASNANADFPVFQFPWNCSPVHISARLRGTIPALQRFWAGKVTRRGNKVASSQYIVRQIATLLKFAKTTSDPGIAAALVEKATHLKDRIDETLPAPDLGPRAPDVEPTA